MDESGLEKNETDMEYIQYLLQTLKANQIFVRPPRTKDDNLLDLYHKNNLYNFLTKEMIDYQSEIPSTSKAKQQQIDDK